MLGWVTSQATMLVPAAGATAQATELISSVSLEATAMSSGRALNSRAAAPCRVSKISVSAASLKCRVP